MSILRVICRIHDAATDAGFVVGTFGLFMMVAIYTYEIVNRYFLGVATDWANDAFANILCVTIFALVPHVTRQGAHISISVLVEVVPRVKPVLRVFTGVLGFAVCALAAWMSLEANIRQVALDIVTEQNRPVPKIYMSAFITFGFFGAALYFLRSLLPDGVVRPVSWVWPQAKRERTGAVS